MSKTRVNAKGEDIETNDEKEAKKQNKAFVQLRNCYEEIEKSWKKMEKAKTIPEKREVAKALGSQAKKLEGEAEAFEEVLG